MLETLPQKCQSPRAQKTWKTLLVQKVSRLPHLMPAWAMTLLINPMGQNLPCVLKHHRIVLSLLDLEFLVDVNPVKAHPCLGPESNHISIHMLQSPRGTIRTSFRPYSILVDT
jgi:hypothetical protein